MQQSFVHLHLHSEYSLSDGLIRIEPLVKAAAEAGLPAIAITEQGNLYSLIKFYRLAQQYGIKPVVGADIKINDDAGNKSSLLLLCQDRVGYVNLTKLITKSYLEGQSQGIPYVRHAWLKGHTDGLIALSGAREGNVGQAIIKGNLDLAKTNLTDWLQFFPDRFYLELQRTARQNEEIYIQGAIDLAISFSVPVVATNDVRFLTEEDYDAHEARVCIQQGNVLNDPRRVKSYSAQQYFKNTAEMVELFQDIP